MAREKSVSITFGELKKGMHARVIGCTACSDEVLRLQEMGLTEGATFEVIKVAPFGDPVEIDLRGYRLCLRKKENCAFILECDSAEPATKADKSLSQAATPTQIDTPAKVK